MPTTPKPELDLPVRLFKDQPAWEAWLAKHHASAAGLWLRLAKKDSGRRSVSYLEAVEAALCYGWIDSQKRSYDVETWIQKFTPRGPRSVWSQINREKALELIEQGRMRAAGRAAIEAAQANGRWDAAYAPQRTAELPADLRSALEHTPAAQAYFATLDSRNRYAILFQLQTAKQPATRQRRLDQFIAMLARREKLYPQRTDRARR